MLIQWYPGHMHKASKEIKEALPDIDLLIEIGPRCFLAVECKTAAAVESRDYRHFTVLQTAYGETALAAGAVVCRTDRPYPLTEGGRFAAIPLGGPEGVCHWLRPAGTAGTR